jgi:hypothetical protein
MLDDGEREKVIGPHLWAPIGTNNLALLPERLKMVVRFALDCAADALDAKGVEHNLRQDFGDNYRAAKDAANAAAKAADWVAHYAADAAAEASHKILDLILQLCAMSTPRELPKGAVSKEETLRVVCHKQ